MGRAAARDGRRRPTVRAALPARSAAHPPLARLARPAHLPSRARAQKGGLINNLIPPSVQTEVNIFTTTVSGALEVITYWVPQYFDVTVSANTYKIVAYVFTAITLIILCIVVALRSAIRTATKAIELGAEALQDMPALILCVAAMAEAVALVAAACRPRAHTRICVCVRVRAWPTTTYRPFAARPFTSHRSFPITTVIALALFMMWWVFVVAGLATSGTAIQVGGAANALAAVQALASVAGVSNATVASFLSAPGVNATYTAIQDVPALQWLIIYHIFGMLWTGSFILGCATMVVAGAVAAWYFGRVPAGAATAATERRWSVFGCCLGSRGALPPGAVLPATFFPRERSPLCSSLARVLRYYLGTVALGSFLIAFLSFVRAALAYVYRRLRAGGQDSQWLRFLCCCVQCCMGCLQRFVEFISRNAYIYTAIKGTGFCSSSAAVVGIIVANAGTVASITVLSEIILFLGKLLIACGASWICFAVLDNTPAFHPSGVTPLTSTWLVIVVNFFFAYLTAAAFMLVFDLAIDTVLICYLLDRAENGGRAAHTDAGRFDEIEREAAAEAREHVLGKAPAEADKSAAQPQPQVLQQPVDATFSYTHPGRGEVVPAPRAAGSADAYM